MAVRRYPEGRPAVGGGRIGSAPRPSYPQAPLQFGAGKNPPRAPGGTRGEYIPPEVRPPTIDELLARNPYFQAAQAQRNAASIADKADRDAAIRRAIIDFGYVPPGLIDFKDQGDTLDATTRDLAAKNTTSGMSIWARLADAAKVQQRDVTNSVGARGLFRSGELSYGLGRSQLQADQGRYDAIKGLNDYISGVQSAWAAAERARAAQAAADANPNAPGNEPPPVWEPSPNNPVGGNDPFPFAHYVPPVLQKGGINLYKQGMGAL